MKKGNEYGIHRVLEPKNFLPQPAWKLDNAIELYDNEILIDVEMLNINSASFTQMYTECSGDPNKISEKILRIVNKRGKLHNPVTGTGGILVGRVKKIGTAYSKSKYIKVGDSIASLSSLSLTPLKINKIKKIDLSLGQVYIEAKAVLFDSSPIIKIPEGIKGNIKKNIIAVLDEAGCTVQTYNLVKQKDTVVILGATSKIGLLCSFAAKKKLKDTGKLIGVVKTVESKKQLENTGIFYKVICADALKTMDTLNKIYLHQGEDADVTINCMNISGTETLSVLLTKDKGILYFAGLSNNINVAALTAEGIGKDLKIYPYKGYIKGHADFAIKLLEEYTQLNNVFTYTLNKSSKKYTGASSVNFSVNLEDKVLSGIDIRSYVFESNEIKAVLNNALKVAKYDCTVLITGESGVGKEIFAQTIHKASPRSNKGMIKINCGSIPENLLEAELFGYEGGAFTGARASGKMGIFEAAKGGTLFLDEIGELPLNLQAKLLRAIQEKEIYRVGGLKPIKIDVRIITATNRNLESMVKRGVFREDLLYRLDVFPIYVPPLRQRRRDIIPLGKYFVVKYNKEYNLNKELTASALAALFDYDWPGNIRELENLIQRLLINTIDFQITDFDVIDNINIYGKMPSNTRTGEETIPLKESLEKIEYSILRSAKEKYKSTRRMAAALDISQATLIRKLRKYNLS